jgi:DNA modification methylase
MPERRSADRTGRRSAREASPAPRKPARKRRPACNSLDGRRWLSNSISVWSDIKKSPEEKRLGHPAIFPSALAGRLIESFLPRGAHVVLDPFAGVGSTLVACEELGKRGIGLEISAEYVAAALKRLGQRLLPFSESAGAGNAAVGSVLYHASARRLEAFVPAESVDLCVTSPPYWNVLRAPRTADHKQIRHYGDLQEDLGAIAEYPAFLDALEEIFGGVLAVLKPGAHCCVVVMDLRKQERFFPLHCDLAARLVKVGYLFDDLIVWNRQAEYNNLRPLGFPSVFRVNKVHEFVLLMRKPQAGSRAKQPRSARK